MVRYRKVKSWDDFPEYPYQYQDGLGILRWWRGLPWQSKFYIIFFYFVGPVLLLAYPIYAMWWVLTH